MQPLQGKVTFYFESFYASYVYHVYGQYMHYRIIHC